MEIFSPTDNQTFDRIIKARHTVRSFSDKVPSREDIEPVVNAGLLAPFASMSSQDVEVFRHFYILFKGNPLISKIGLLIQNQSQADVEQFLEEKKTDAIIAQYGAPIENLWTNIAKQGVHVDNIPCLIVIAEWRGARRAEKQSLAHAMQNMWLKATALNLGFQLISAIESMTNNADFCSLFGYKPGQYGFHACIVGYPLSQEYTPKKLRSAVTWL